MTLVCWFYLIYGGLGLLTVLVLLVVRYSRNYLHRMNVVMLPWHHGVVCLLGKDVKVC